MGDTARQKPEPPQGHECCGGGSCCPCVWDTYYEDMRRWQVSQGQSPTITAPSLESDQSTYR